MDVAKNHAQANPVASANTQTIGWREWVSLPDLGIPKLKAKIDSGARTSALHAFSVEPYTHDDGTEWVRFGIHPSSKSKQQEVFCQAPILDRRSVRDSGGHQEQRIVISTNLSLGVETFPIEVTLTSRDDMLFRMLIGRTAMHDRFTIDPAKSYMTKKSKSGSK